MPEPAIDLLDEVWTAVIDLCRDLDEAQWKLPTDLPGWSVQDNVAHLIGIERMMAGEPTPDVELPTTDHLRNDVGTLNEHWVESRRRRPGAEVLAELEQVAADRLGWYRSLSDDELDALGPTPVGEAPFRIYIAVRVMDSWAHEQDIRRALDRPGHLSGPAAALSLGRLFGGLPMVVGKRAAAPDGSSVVLRIEGDEPAVVPVVVDGRAAVVEEVPDAPTVAITMDAETFLTLATGRRDPDEALDRGAVTIVGDDALGRAVVTRMNFMI